VCCDVSAAADGRQHRRAAEFVLPLHREVRSLFGPADELEQSVWISCGVISCRRRPLSRSSTRSTRRSPLEMSAAVRRWRQARPDQTARTRRSQPTRRSSPGIRRTMPSVLSGPRGHRHGALRGSRSSGCNSGSREAVTVSDESVAATLAQLRGIAENGSLVDRVQWIRKRLDHVEVFDDHAEAHWRETEEQLRHQST